MKHIELETPIEEMEEADLRATFSEVMDAHEANVAEFADLTEKAEQAATYSEKIEELQGDLDDASAYFAEKASTVTKLSVDVLADRFSMGELVELAGQADDEAASFSRDSDIPCDTCDDPAGCADDGSCKQENGGSGDESLFAEKPQKSPKFSADVMASRKDAAKSRLSMIGGLKLE